MNKELSADKAGIVSLGEQLSVNRLGFGAMRLTGEGIWGPPKDHDGALAVLRRFCPNLMSVQLVGQGASHSKRDRPSQTFAVVGWLNALPIGRRPTF